ncbi:3'(2'),5'-bisphosphate nucleotidase CysQ family protein [Nitratidesulfovibrio sp. D1]|uniref:3'(2'),5'-bisphosphate nucleotidase CysQ family protein n=1 Tax=Nitratidesulfovibrio sp. D1 TaxID=3440151 RepID=UPI003EC082EE
MADGNREGAAGRDTVFPLLDLLPLVEAAGAVILDWCGGAVPHIRRKADDSPVTEADDASQAVLAEGLARLRPDLPVLSEEGRIPPHAERAGWPRFLLVDPLDGTRGFLNGEGDFAVCVALVERGRPTAGILHFPALGVTWYGGRGYGAWRVEHGPAPEPVRAARTFPRRATVMQGRVRRTPRLDAYLAAHPDIRSAAFPGRSGAPAPAPVPMPPDPAAQDRLRAGLFPHRRMQAGGPLKFCLVAEGVAHVFPCMHPTWEWDTAPGQALLEGAGGVVTLLDGTPLAYNKPDLRNGFILAVGPSGGAGGPDGARDAPA